jgi:hypothetical protein
VSQDALHVVTLALVEALAGVEDPRQRREVAARVCALAKDPEALAELARELGKGGAPNAGAPPPAIAPAAAGSGPSSR